MALTSNAELLSTVSAEALRACKVLVLREDKSLLHDAIYNDGMWLEWKTFPTGRVQSQPEYQPYMPVVTTTVEAHAHLMEGRGVGIDFSGLEQRAIAHMMDEMELYTNGKLYGTTTQSSAEPEPLTIEKLEALMVEYGLMKPKQPKRDHWAMWGFPYITVKNRFFDLETCAT
ncbi:hypothetical protein Cp1R7AA1_192 [Mesorhizobium phage Cp1R7A-A1]|nr:hypothetical protein Cp1R7AA1_192 [Mesorhizobium phage Cp1R7A-A1]